jgi:hypothetical protein
LLLLLASASLRSAWAASRSRLFDQKCW